MEKIKRFGVAAVILLLTMAILPIPNIKIEAQSIPEIEDPTPGYWETSMYMIRSVAVSIILPESNGAIDPSTEDWNETEEQNVINEVQYALDWWANQNLDANVTFVTQIQYRVPTSYEPINRPGSDIGLWIGEVMTFLGHPPLGRFWLYQVRDYVNAVRNNLGTDWCFVIFVIDSSNDPDGNFPDGGHAFNIRGGPLIYMTSTLGHYGAENMNRITAHEVGNIFWVADEDSPNLIYGGYLNTSNVPGSGCLMDNLSWCLSGASHGHNGTWGQVGWRDSDGDGIQDIVDTFPRVYLNTSERIEDTINYTGVAAVTPYPNKNPSGSQRNVTINKIQSVQYRIDSGDWLNATIKPTTLQKLIRYPDTYETKNTTAIVNFNFTTPTLSPGEYFIEVKAINSVGNEGYANETVTIPELVNDIALVDVIPGKTVVCQNYSMNINVTVENQGDVTETFNVTLYANTIIVETKEITLTSGNSTTITFNWNTTGFPLGNYTMKAIADQVPGEIDTVDNTFTDGTVKLTIVGDVNGDEIVDIFDCVIIALAFGSIPDNPNWNSNADINNDSIVDIFDLVLVATHYGETCP